MFREELCQRSISADFDRSQLLQRPGIEVGGPGVTVSFLRSKGTIHSRSPDEGDMNAQITVYRRAIETQVDTEGDRCPCWVLGRTVKALLRTWMSAYP